jgi:hypothetical protein
MVLIINKIVTMRILYLCTISIFFGYLITGCYNEGMLVLTKSKIDKNYQIDTIEAYPERGLYLVGVTINKALGKFDYGYSIIKRKYNSDDLVYTLIDNSNWPRVSKDYISLTKIYTESKWGWFCLRDGKIMNNLPHMDKIIDSLKLIKPTDVFIQEASGDIRFYKNGKIVKTFDYGYFETKYKDQKFDSLDYKLYKLDGDSLNVVSNDGNDLFRQRDGVYFIPPPGYGVLNKFSKQNIFDAVDSVSRLTSPPDILKFKSIQ